MLILLTASRISIEAKAVCPSQGMSKFAKDCSSSNLTESFLLWAEFSVSCSCVGLKKLAVDVLAAMELF